MTEKPIFARVQRKMIAARIEFLAALARVQSIELPNIPTEEECSPLQIAYHLSITDGLALEQMYRIQEEDTPQIINIAEIATHTPVNLSSPSSLPSILATMTAQREAIFRYLASLPESAWARSFHQEQWGQHKFEQFINLLPLHDKLATHQLEMIRARRTQSS